MAPHAVTDRSRFRQVLSEIAEKAKARLPESTGRLDKAVALVLAGDVEGQDDDGSWRVGSACDPLTTHRVMGTSCSCPDSQHGKAPFCKHVLAVMLTVRVQEVLETEAPQAPASGHACQTLPEAPSSVNFRCQVGPFEMQFTLRDSDEHRLLARLQDLLQDQRIQPLATKGQAPRPQHTQLSPQQHNAAAMHRPTTGFCAVHNAQMKRNEKDGRSWYSHYVQDEGRFCKGR